MREKEGLGKAGSRITTLTHSFACVTRRPACAPVFLKSVVRFMAFVAESPFPGQPLWCPWLLPSLLLNGFHIAVSQPPGDRIQSALGLYHHGLEVILLTGELIVAEGGGVLGRGAIWSWVSCPSRLLTSSLELQAKILPLSCWESPAHLHRGCAVFPRDTGNVLSAHQAVLPVLHANLHDSHF